MKLRDQMPELDVSAKWLNSKPLSKMDVTGTKPTLIFFWAVSCETCKQAMPNVKALSHDYKGVMNVITVHMPLTGQDHDLAEVRRVAKEHHMSEPIMADHEHALTNQFRSRYVPSYYLFDASGYLRHRHTGNMGMPLLRRRLNRMLKETTT